MLGKVTDNDVDENRSINRMLINEILSWTNISLAIERVRANKGAPGVDGMTVDELEAHFRRNWKSITDHIKHGTYIPSPVKRVDIPKPDGGTRMLGIPTVQDRTIQQAINQVLMPIFDPTFSEYSYGFRPNRSALDAVRKASEYIAEGKSWVVEIDLAKFFDTVNHDRLMSTLARRIDDKALLKLIRRYLKAGIMADGLVSAREEGVPQGGNLSPLLSLIVLDELDKNLEKRGIAFCRYADDCNLFVSSKMAGERVLEKTTKFIEEKLKLRVNQSKSGTFRPSKCKYLGYTFVGTTGQPRAHAKSLKRLRQKLYPILRTYGRGMSMEVTIKRLTQILRGWMNYYSLDNRKGIYRALDIWIRRHLRKLLWISWKQPKTRESKLLERGLGSYRAWKSSVNGRGAWWNAKALHMLDAFPNAWFAKQGLYSLEKRG